MTRLLNGWLPHFVDASVTTDRDRQRAEAVVRELDQLGLLAQSSRTRNVAGALRHPVVVGATLAVLSGILASLAIPALTRVWQDRPRQLELKRGLIEKMSEPVTDAVIRTRYFQQDVDSNRTSPRRAFFTKINREWRINSALVDAQLAPYYRDSALPASWHRYVDAVTSYFTYATNAGSPRWRDHLLDVHGSRPSLVDFFKDARFTPGSKAEESRAQFIAEGEPEPTNDRQYHDYISHETLLISELLLAKRDQLRARSSSPRHPGLATASGSSSSAPPTSSAETCSYALAACYPRCYPRRQKTTD